MTGRIEEGTGSTPSSVDEKVYTLKFVMAGSSGVGKTQLAQRIIRGRFRETSLPTVGIEFGTRALRYADHSSVRAQIWDVAGQVRFKSFKSVTEAFYRGAVGAMVVYDISRRSTFDELPAWLEHVRSHCHESIAVVLVGNKSDMSSKQREVSMVEGMRFARKHGLDFLETSALEDTNVEEACRQLVMSVARYLPQEKSVWAATDKPSYRLPKGWVRVVDDASDSDDDCDCDGCDGDDDDYDDDEEEEEYEEENVTDICSPFDASIATGSLAAHPNSNGSHIGGNQQQQQGGRRAPRVWYENTWTGKRVISRPLYPAGPSDTCVVTHVPRPPDPLTFMASPVKGGLRGRRARGKGDGEGGGGQGPGEFKIRWGAEQSSWSFSTLRETAGGHFPSAVECLVRCVDSTE